MKLQPKKLKAVSPKRVERPIRVETNDDWQHCCRWCHYYDNGRCYKPGVYADDGFNVYGVAESGKLDEAISEVLGNDKLNSRFAGQLDDILMGWKISTVRRTFFKKVFLEELEKHHLEVQEHISEAASVVYQNEYDIFLESECAIRITNPEEYCCKDWC